jgi:hypothetical protein
MPTTSATASLPSWREAEPDGAARSRVAPNVHGQPRPAAWDEIDTTLEASFPASDPPSWTLGTDPHAPP